MIAVDSVVSTSTDTIRVQAEVARAKLPVTVLPLGAALRSIMP